MGPKPLIDLLRQRSRPYLFSNSLSPALVGGASKVFELITEDPSHCQSVLSNTRQFRTAMESAGFRIGGDPDHPIAPVHFGHLDDDAVMASTFAEKMLERGIYVIAFSFPVVPRGAARIRVQLSAAHEPADIEQAVAAFTEVGKEMGVI